MCSHLGDQVTKEENLEQVFTWSVYSPVVNHLINLDKVNSYTNNLAMKTPIDYLKYYHSPYLILWMNDPAVDSINFILKPNIQVRVYCP